MQVGGAVAGEVYGGLLVKACEQEPGPAPFGDVSVRARARPTVERAIAHVLSATRPTDFLPPRLPSAFVAPSSPRPTLWSWAESIRQSELAEIEARSTSLTPEVRRQLDAVTRSLVKKLLHEPTLRLRAPDNRDNGLRHLESLRYLFGLAEGQDAAAARPAQAAR